MKTMTLDDLLKNPLTENNKNIALEKSKEIWIKQIQENPNIKYFGAVENGKVVSTCYCVIIPNLTNFCQPICFVENVVTDKNYRNQGLGKKVIDKAIETAKKNNCVVKQKRLLTSEYEIVRGFTKTHDDR